MYIFYQKHVLSLYSPTHQHYDQRSLETRARRRVHTHIQGNDRLIDEIYFNRKLSIVLSIVISSISTTFRRFIEKQSSVTYKDA